MGSAPTRSAVRFAVAASVLVILAAACTSSSGGAPSGASTGVSPAPAASTAASASTSAGGGRYDNGGDDYGTPTVVPSASSDDSGAAKVHEVNLGNSDDGPYLTGEDGLALYVFGNDSANTSTCSGGCAQTWPPFTIHDADTLKAGTGVKGKLTTFARADGSLQVAYGGSPLYYYSADQAAGDTKGNGIGDVWFIAKP